LPESGGETRSAAASIAAVPAPLNLRFSVRPVFSFRIRKLLWIPRLEAFIASDEADYLTAKEEAGYPFVMIS
jgi:hypothetical protein